MAKGVHTDLLAQVEAKVEERKARFEAANAKVSARAGRDLFAAIGVGLLLGTIVVLALFVWPFLLLPLALAVMGLGLYELATAFRKAGRRVPRVGVIFGGAVIILLTWFYSSQGMLFGVYFAGSVLIIWRLIEGFLPRFEVPGRTMIADLAAGVFCLIYLPFLLSLILLLSQIPGNGSWWVFTLILLPVINDISAYAVGLNFGKHKMSPRVSPNKTWEGFIGAGICVVATALFAGTFLLGLGWISCVLLGLTVLCTATGGDLTESLIKRNLGVKDMSSLVPGHGGVLDRLDSILPSAVPFFIAAALQGVL